MVASVCLSRTYIAVFALSGACPPPGRQRAVSGPTQSTVVQQLLDGRVKCKTVQTQRRKACEESDGCADDDADDDRAHRLGQQRHAQQSFMVAGHVVADRGQEGQQGESRASVLAERG